LKSPLSVSLDHAREALSNWKDDPQCARQPPAAIYANLSDPAKQLDGLLELNLTGIRARVLLRFQEFECPPRYDGVWTCASLLHVPRGDLHEAVKRLVKALKPSGGQHVSFKYGSGERVADDGRFYTDMYEEDLCGLFSPFSDMAVADVWISMGESTDHGKDAWLNAMGIRFVSRRVRQVRRAQIASFR
jgi:hypothetical protein